MQKVKCDIWGLQPRPPAQDFQPLEWHESIKEFLRPNGLRIICMLPDNKCTEHEDLTQCGTEGELWRTDSETGECMGEGWCFEDGEAYIWEESRAEDLSQRWWGQTISEAYAECEAEDITSIYYTQWF
ncbi:hypothetical protein ACN08Y_10100 [Rothia sp. P5764]|uniref:hypothetical protein n=1 Tax=Rothia sp. P5764 TaxID=3402654 RepID=UPI003ACC61DC